MNLKPPYLSSSYLLIFLAIQHHSLQLCPGAVLTKLDKLVEPLRTTVTTKVKANAVKQEYEKQDELKRSAMRAVAALMAIPGAGKRATIFVSLPSELRRTSH